MKTLLSLLLVFTLANLTIAQTTAIPDPNFEQALINLGLDATLDGQVLTANIDTVDSLDVSNKNIGNLTGIQNFIGLIWLDCSSNPFVILDFTQNEALTYLNCSNNPFQLTSLNVIQNADLTYLNCSSIQLSSLNVTQNTALTYLYCSNNLLTSLDITQNTVLAFLSCHNNQLNSLDVSQNTDLNYIDIYDNQIISLDVSQNIALTNLKCFYTLLSSLDLSQNIALTQLTCFNNQLNCLNVKNGNNTNFLSFIAIGNPLLTCIEVDNVAYSTANWTNVDTQTSFSTNCGNPCSVGIEENSLSNLSLYPNPTTGNIAIDLGEVKKGVKATLTNSLGQVLLTQNYNATNIIYLGLDYPNGLYFLTLATDGEVITKKIIKQ